MKKLSILLTKHYRPISIAALLDVFQTVNHYYQENTGMPYFDIRLIRHPEDGTVAFPDEQYQPLHHEEVTVSDLVLIPAFRPGNISDYLRENSAFIPWVRQQAAKGAEVASFCTGAFMLAATGLLDQRRATTHVTAVEALSRNFPEVIVDADVVVTDDRGVYTSGGATSTFHLLLHILEKYCDRTTAIYTAKVFAIDMDRAGQSYFANWSPSRAHNDELVTAAQQRMEERFQDRVTVEEVIHDLPVSRRNFIRRFKTATGVTPIEYLQRIRIEAAKKLLEGKQENITGVMIQAGYEDAKAFRQLFRKIVGLSPKEYREKYAG